MSGNQEQTSVVTDSNRAEGSPGNFITRFGWGYPMMAVLGTVGTCIGVVNIDRVLNNPCQEVSALAVAGLGASGVGATTGLYGSSRLIDRFYQSGQRQES